MKIVSYPLLMLFKELEKENIVRPEEKMLFIKIYKKYNLGAIIGPRIINVIKTEIKQNLKSKESFSEQIKALEEKVKNKILIQIETDFALEVAGLNRKEVLNLLNLIILKNLQN